LDVSYGVVGRVYLGGGFVGSDEPEGDVLGPVPFWWYGIDDLDFVYLGSAVVFYGYFDLDGVGFGVLDDVGGLVDEEFDGLSGGVGANGDSYAWFLGCFEGELGLDVVVPVSVAYGGG